MSTHSPRLVPARTVRFNARLTALTGMLLLVLLFIEGVTIPLIGQLITWHIAVGTLLIAPVAVKLVATGTKIVRYYTGDPAFVAEGPPPPARRLLGPFVMLLSVIVIATGVVLAIAGPGHGGTWLFLHKASFVLWFGVMTLHVLTHILRTAQATASEYLDRGPSALAGRSARALVLGATLLVGLGLAAYSLHWATPWVNAFSHGGFGGH